MLPVRLDPAPSGPKLDFLAAQILDAPDLLTREDMQLRHRQTDDVIDPAFEIGRLSMGAEIFKDVGLRHGDVDPAQVEKVVEIGRRPIGDHRDDTHLVAIIQDLRELVREGHVGA